MLYERYKALEIKISIHAPAKGATSLLKHPTTNGYDFNPRTREGCDMAERKSNTTNSPISIHAPAKGATRLCNSVINLLLFQSTHPRRVRQVKYCITRKAVNFNPRTREGCDIVHHGQGFYSKISIHAPAKGATSSRCMV